MVSKKRGDFVIQLIFKDLDKFGKTLTERQLLFSYRESFSYTGVMSTNFSIEGKVDEIIDIFT